MSLYGALFSGVSGLKAQSSKIAVISDNISNVNTVGYKGGQAQFQTLVTTASGATAYSPGGVLGGNRQLVSKQGLLQSTDTPTDIAISGDGFFVVNQTADQSGQVLYTRAGAFRADSTGNFRNSAGFFLQAWPLDREGRLPGEPGNLNTTSSASLSSLQTVNVQSLTGTAAATSTIALGANLKAGEAVYPGAAAVMGMDLLDTVNVQNGANDIIVPQPAGTLDRLTEGDDLTVSTDSGLTYTYTYGGITFTRNVTTGLGADNGSGDLGNGQTTLGANPIATTNTSNVVTITQAGHGFVTGQVIAISGVPGAINNIPASELNASHVITVTGVNTYTITVTTAANANGSGGGAAVIADSRPFADTGNILDAATINQTFLGTTGTSGFTTAALSFTITTASTGTNTFTYTATSPSAQDGQFNTLTNLAEAINEVTGLTARIVNNQLYISAINGEDNITFANGSVTGTSGPPVQAGINWVSELGLVNVTGVANQFSTLQGLANLVNASTGLTATLTNPLVDTELSINVDDPSGTITFTDDAGNTGSLVAALAINDHASLGGAAFAVQTEGPFGPSYDPTDSTKNMASGAIAPQFTRPVRVFDSLGSGHDLNISFLKVGVNEWAVEIYAVPSTDVVATDGLLAYGNIQFNGDGTLRQVGTLLAQPVGITWAPSVGAEASTITFDWGTAGPAFSTGASGVIGLTDGLSQFDSGYNVNFVNQNGAPVGELTGIAIDEDGFIIASYSNGETQELYKIPLAKFANPDQLRAITGNVYAQTGDSGEVNLTEAGTSGVGKVSQASLEQSNVELADQLTDMIVAQRAYQANTKIISTADSLLDELNRILQ
jgi:flagellar hook protein FlgE